jgi:hypothetical protein
MKKTNCKYQRQDADMTLREGIDEYFAANPNLLLPSKHDKETAGFFHSHDRVHVVFGCDTSFVNELRADFWTIFGSDVGFFNYLSFIKNPGVKMIMNDLSKIHDADKEVFRAELKKSAREALSTPMKVYLRARKMKKKWPWIGSEAFLDKPLSEIREGFGIEVFRL